VLSQLQYRNSGNEKQREGSRLKMARRGPQPQPAALKKLRGYPGHHPRPVEAPPPPATLAADVRPLTGIGGASKKFYDSLVAEGVPSASRLGIIEVAARAHHAYGVYTRRLARTGAQALKGPERARTIRAQQVQQRTLLDALKQLHARGSPMVPRSTNGHTAAAAPAPDARREAEARWYMHNTFDDDDSSGFTPHDAVALRREWRRDPRAEAEWRRQRGIEFRRNRAWATGPQRA